jgi:GntR family transcriptional regulator, transcriptional repressor for pyruvate dehydrogenase complex
MKKDDRNNSPPVNRPDSGHGNTLFVPLPPRRAFKEVEKQIRTLIYSKHLKPGDRLPSEKELAVQIGVGRLSVREALRMLEQAGLITVKQGATGGSYVKKLDSNVTVESLLDLMWQENVAVRDVVDVRCGVEKIVLEKAFRNMTNENLITLEKSVGELETLVSEGQEKEYPVDPTLTEFHVLLAEFTGNPVFPIILKVLIQVAVRVLVPATVNLDRLKKHASSHRAIFEALKKADLDEAVRAVEKHMLEVGDREPQPRR